MCEREQLIWHHDNLSAFLLVFMQIPDILNKSLHQIILDYKTCVNFQL